MHAPLGLETAMFLADVLIKYHQQLRLEHNIRYVTSDCAKSFGKTLTIFQRMQLIQTLNYSGRAYDSKVESNDDESKLFWAQTSLLAGWEIIRR